MPKAELVRVVPGTSFDASSVRLIAPRSASAEELLTPQTLGFIGQLERAFRERRRELLERRRAVQVRLDGGWLPTLPDPSSPVRSGEWRVPAPPADLDDRRVEITGPVDRKMIVNALNSGAQVFMADFEDANSPTWENTIAGQANLRDAVRRSIDFVDPRSSKAYRLGPKTATLMVRPRGWHLVEKHVLVDGRPASASLFDFGLFFFHNARELIERGSGPYFYLPKLESALEARLWNDVFLASQDALGIPSGTIRATVLIETVLAAFEMEEILFELREHSAGLNCGRWDYIFSFIKRFRSRPEFVLPDRGSVGMDRHFLRSYSQLLVQTCHRRGAHAMGGMAAQIPIKDDPERNAQALSKVAADKRREAEDGHDGTWVAHPGLIAAAREAFDPRMPGPNQIADLREDVAVTAADLLDVPRGSITEQGLRQNLNVGVRYLEAWLGGRGCVPLYDLMEDAATAEISRTQVWQWRTHGARLADGRPVDRELIRGTLADELRRMRAESDPGTRPHLRLAASLFEQLILKEELEEFLTSIAYTHL